MANRLETIYRVKEEETGWFIIEETRGWREDRSPVWEPRMVWSKPLGEFRPQKRWESSNDYWEKKREHERRVVRFHSLKEARNYIKKLKKGFPIYYEP